MLASLLLFSLLGGPQPLPRPLRPLPAVTTLTPEVYFARPRLQAERTPAQRIMLRWQAQLETGVQGYTVERSDDGTHWLPLDYLPLNPRHQYSYLTTCITSAYFRLVRLDFNRQLVCSPRQYVPRVRFPTPPQVCPNRVHSLVNLRGFDPTLPVDVLNREGEVVEEASEVEFCTLALKPGVYALRQGHQVARLIIR